MDDYMNGKGSRPRNNADLKSYWNNYDSIFRKKKEELTDEDQEKFESDKDQLSYSELQKVLKND